MNANMRTTLASLGFGTTGAAVGAIWQYMKVTLVDVFPPLNAGIGLSIASISGFLCYLLAYQLYARSGHTLGSVFGGLAGAVSGAATGIGYILSYDKIIPNAVDLVMNGLFGALIGGFLGTMLGFVLCPWLAKVTKSKF